MLYPSLNKSICACPGILVVIRAIPSLPCWDLRSTLANYTASSCIAHASFLAFFKPHSPCLAPQSKAKFHSKGYVTIVLLKKKKHWIRFCLTLFRQPDSLEARHDPYREFVARGLR